MYDAELLLDTGASYSSLTPAFIAQLVQENRAEKTGIQQIVTAVGVLDVDTYKVEKISVGHFSVNDVVVVELDLNTSRNIASNLDGLLGMNFLSHFNFTIDQDSNQLYLTPKFK